MEQDKEAMTVTKQSAVRLVAFKLRCGRSHDEEMCLRHEQELYIARKMAQPPGS